MIMAVVGILILIVPKNREQDNLLDHRLPAYFHRRLD
jgi:hypothetical protein